MTVTITLKGVLLTALALVGIVLIIYLIALIRKTIGTLTRVDEILADTKVISETAAEKTKKIDEIVGNASEAVGTVVEAVKGNQSIVKGITNLVNATSSFTGIIKNAEKVSPKKRKKRC